MVEGILPQKRLGKEQIRHIKSLTDSKDISNRSSKKLLIFRNREEVLITPQRREELRRFDALAEEQSREQAERREEQRLRLQTGPVNALDSKLTRDIPSSSASVAPITPQRQAQLALHDLIALQQAAERNKQEEVGGRTGRTVRVSGADRRGLPAVSDLVSPESKLNRGGSIIACFTPIAVALLKAEGLLGSDRDWRGDRIQTAFMARYISNRVGLAGILNLSPSDPMKLQSIASRDRQEIINFLKSQGAGSIELPPFTRPTDFGMAASMDVLIEWLFAGTPGRLTGRNKMEYDAAVLGNSVDFFSSNVSDRPVAYIPTKHEGYSFGMTIPNRPIRDAFDLINYITQIQRSDLQEAWGYNRLIFPMVNLVKEEGLGWLIGMSTTDSGGKDVVVTSASQKNTFKLNHKGARAKSEVAISSALRGTNIEKPLTIDEPFICWIEKQRVLFPVWAGHIDYSDWHNPGNL